MTKATKTKQISSKTAPMAGCKDKDDALVGGDGNMPTKSYKKKGKG